MDYLTVLKHDIFTIPKERLHSDFQEHIDSNFKEFFRHIDRIDKGTFVKKLKTLRPRIESLCNGISESLRLYNLGSLYNSMEVFNSELDKVHDNILYDLSSNRTSLWERDLFFRARPGTTIQYNLAEIFHVPFEKRDFVSTARYSVPGLPCLYGSNSTYLCWEELRRPEINNVQFTRLKCVAPRMILLDLTHTATYITDTIEFGLKPYKKPKRTKRRRQLYLNGYDKWIESFLIKWPILFAVSTKVQNTAAPHKPEYIFPQYLMQWISQQRDIYGIRYFSVEAGNSGQKGLDRFYNYAIPVKTVAKEGHCSFLKNSFEVCYPLSWNSIQISNPANKEITPEEMLKYFQTISHDFMVTLELNKGNRVHYFHSMFGRIEMELAKQKFFKIP